MNKKIKIVILILLFLVLGFLRENFFKNINAQIISLAHPSGNYELSSWLTFLGNYSTSTLLKVKWIATLLFAGLFLILTMVLCQTLFDNKINKYLPVLIYAGVILISFMAVGIGKLIPATDASTYYFSRWLMGAAQSPLLPGIICILFYYYLEQKKTIQK